MIINTAYKGGKLEVQHSSPDTILRWTKRFKIAPALIRELYKLPTQQQEELLAYLRVLLRFSIKDHSCCILHATAELSARPCYIEYTIRAKNVRPDSLLPQIRASFKGCVKAITDKIHA